MIVEGLVDFDYEITQLTVRALGATARSRPSFCEPIGHRQVEGRLRRELAAAADDARRPRSAARDIAAQGHRRRWAAAASSASSCSSRATRSGSPRSARARTTPAWSPWPPSAQSEFALHARAILGLPVDVALREPGAQRGDLRRHGRQAASPSRASPRRWPCRARTCACSASPRAFAAPPHGRRAGHRAGYRDGPRTGP